MSGSEERFAGRTAVVWGGGAGIGAATATLLAAGGARVVVVDLEAAAAAATCHALAHAGYRARAMTSDVRDEAAVERVLDEIGVVHLSASVVGVAAWCDLIDMTGAMWDEQIALNLRPMFLIGRAVARRLRDAGQGGSLGFVGSIAGAQGAARHAAYGAAKAAMASLAQSMALEWGPLGIRVNCVAAGPIATARIVPSPAMDALLARKIPAGRFGTSEEIAQCLSWLLSDAASFVTGTTMLADGGWMAAPTISPGDNPALPGTA